MSSPGIRIGVNCVTSLADVYTDLLADAGDTLLVSSNDHKILVLPAGLIQSADVQQGVADGESILQIENNASLLANIPAGPKL